MSSAFDGWEERNFIGYPRGSNVGLAEWQQASFSGARSHAEK